MNLWLGRSGHTQDSDHAHGDQFMLEDKEYVYMYITAQCHEHTWLYVSCLQLLLRVAFRQTLWLCPTKHLLLKHCIAVSFVPIFAALS